MSFMKALEPSLWNVNMKKDGAPSSCFCAWELKPRCFAPGCNFQLIIWIRVNFVLLLIRITNTYLMDCICLYKWMRLFFFFCNFFSRLQIMYVIFWFNAYSGVKLIYSFLHVVKRIHFVGGDFIFGYILLTLVPHLKPHSLDAGSVANVLPTASHAL